MAKLRELEAKIKAGDQNGAATKSAELKKASKKIDVQFDALGAKTCGSGSSSSSSDTSSTDTADTSAVDSSSTDTASADTTGTDTGSGGGAAAAVCKEVPCIKEITDLVSAAAILRRPRGAARRRSATRRSSSAPIAKAVPASLRSDAQLVAATTWQQYSDALNGVAPGDTAALDQVQAQFAGPLGSGPEVKALDAYLAQC